MVYTMCGKRFYGNQDAMLQHAADAVIYIKFGQTKFTSFDSFDTFWEWYFRTREHCRFHKIAFAVFEILRTGNNMCFIADLEVYCPPETHWTQLQKMEYIIKNLFRKAYGRYADADNLVISRNSRMSEYNKVPMYKISLHFLGRSEIFDEMGKGCEMKELAKLVNTALVADMKDLVTQHDILLPGGDVLDLGIYTRNRPMSLIGTAKTLGGGAFALVEESKHMPIRECIVTQQIAGDVSYFELSEDLKEKNSEGRMKKKTKRNISTRQLVHKTATRETSETERLLLDYLQTEFGDSVIVKHNGLYGGQDSYAVRGHRFFCPCCEASHDHNGAFLTHLGGLFFRYKCMNPHAPRTTELDLREFHRMLEPEEPEKPRYLPSFTHVEAKVISICAGMGTGKTTQIIADKDRRKPKRVLVITCRRGMATNMNGRFTGFKSYLDAINADHQIIEYESIHRLNCLKYDMIIMDELRSTLHSAVCRTTNNGHMNQNMEKLQDLIYLADRVICADADLHIDGAVESFYAEVFKGEEIHRINHTRGGQELHVKWASDAAFVHQIQQDLRAGKKIGVCCGSAQELKTLEKLALDIVDEEEVGVYYANSPKQAEISDVDAHWPNYKFIAFTSTITVSVDYQVAVDKVYITPSRMGCGPRDMNQMKSRFRNITSKLVVVKIPKSLWAPLKPLNADMSALHSAEMTRIMNRRAYVTDVLSESERDLNRTIFKQGVGHNAKFYPSLLTELWAWSNVERFLADYHWIQYMIQIFQAKGYTWSTTIDRIDDAAVQEAIDAKLACVKAEQKALLEKVDVYGMDGEEFEELVGKQKKGVATLEDVAMIQKYRVQRFFRGKVDANDVEQFNEFKLPIFNRAFRRAFPPPIARKRIDTNLQLMRASLDDFNPSYDISEKIIETLEKMGFKDMGIGEERPDLKNMPDDAKKKLDDTITAIRKAKLVRGSRAKDPLEEFKSYLSSILGYKLKYHKVQKNKARHSVYSLVDKVPEKLLSNEIYSDTWLAGHCREVDKLIGRGHDERKLIKSQLPMMGTIPEEFNVACSRKRKCVG